MRLLTLTTLLALTAAKKHKRKHESSDVSIVEVSNTKLAKGMLSVKEAVRGDRDFLRNLKSMRVELLGEAGEERDRQWAELLSGDKGPVMLTESLTVSWLPVECKVLGLDLKTGKTIHAGKRNCLEEVSDRTTGHRYAYKTFDNGDEYTAELTFFMVADHPYFVKPKCIVREGRRPGIVMELVTGSGNSIKYAQESGVDGTDLARISAQLLEAMEYIHWLGFVHADMKPENVLVDENGDIKVIDFGFAIPLPFGKRSRGTPTTIAPELVGAVRGEIHEGIDWWAYGSTLAMWYSAHYDQEKWVPVRVKRGEPMVFGDLPSALPTVAREVIHLCLHPDPEARRFNTPAQSKHLRSMALFSRVSWAEIASH